MSPPYTSVYPSTSSWPNGPRSAPGENMVLSLARCCRTTNTRSCRSCVSCRGGGSLSQHAPTGLVVAVSEGLSRAAELLAEALPDGGLYLRSARSGRRSTRSWRGASSRCLTWPYRARVDLFPGLAYRPCLQRPSLPESGCLIKCIEFDLTHGLNCKASLSLPRITQPPLAM